MKKRCKEHFEKLSEYLDGTLEKGLCEEIEDHLSKCPECRNCLESMRKTIKLCKEGSEEKIPADFHERLRSKLRECMSDTSTPLS
jgi:anti-sigma factor RsiW